MPVTAPQSWTNLTNKPTTVAGLGVSDFNTQAIAAQSAATLGAVGSYAFLMGTTAGATLTEGSTYAGSGLRWSGADQNTSTAALLGASLSTAPSGTWRAMGRGGQGVGFGITLCLRIS